MAIATGYLFARLEMAAVEFAGRLYPREGAAATDAAAGQPGGETLLAAASGTASPTADQQVAVVVHRRKCGKAAGCRPTVPLDSPPVPATRQGTRTSVQRPGNLVLPGRFFSSPRIAGSEKSDRTCAAGTVAEVLAVGLAGHSGAAAVVPGRGELAGVGTLAETKVAAGIAMLVEAVAVAAGMDGSAVVVVVAAAVVAAVVVAADAVAAADVVVVAAVVVVVVVVLVVAAAAAVVVAAGVAAVLVELETSPAPEAGKAETFAVVLAAVGKSPLTTARFLLVAVGAVPAAEGGTAAEMTAAVGRLEAPDPNAVVVAAVVVVVVVVVVEESPEAVADLEASPEFPAARSAPPVVGPPTLNRPHPEAVGAETAAPGADSARRTRQDENAAAAVRATGLQLATAAAAAELVWTRVRQMSASHAALCPSLPEVARAGREPALVQPAEHAEASGAARFGQGGALGPAGGWAEVLPSSDARGKRPEETDPGLTVDGARTEAAPAADHPTGAAAAAGEAEASASEEADRLPGAAAAAEAEASASGVAAPAGATADSRLGHRAASEGQGTRMLGTAEEYSHRGDAVDPLGTASPGGCRVLVPLEGERTSHWQSQGKLALDIWLDPGGERVGALTAGEGVPGALRRPRPRGRGHEAMEVLLAYCWVWWERDKTSGVLNRPASLPGWWNVPDVRAEAVRATSLADIPVSRGAGVDPHTAEEHWQQPPLEGPRGSGTVLEVWPQEFLEEFWNGMAAGPRLLHPRGEASSRGVGGPPVALPWGLGRVQSDDRVWMLSAGLEASFVLFANETARDVSIWKVCSPDEGYWLWAGIIGW